LRRCYVFELQAKKAVCNIVCIKKNAIFEGGKLLPFCFWTRAVIIYVLIFFKMTNKFYFVLFCFMLFCGMLKAEGTNTSGFNSNSGFVEEAGQFKMFDNLRFYWHNDNAFVYFLTDKVVFITQEITHEDNAESLEAKSKGDDNLSKKLSAITTARRFDLVFENINNNLTVVGENRLSYKTDYYLGHCPDGILNVPSYAEIRYSDIYPGIDLVFSIEGEILKYEFVVNPGANPNDIILQWDGVEKLQLNANGEIDFSVGSFDFTDKAPVSYNAGAEVVTRFKADGSRVGFEIDEYNENQTLIIDPGLVWASSLQYNGYGSWGGLVSNSAGDFYSVDWEWDPEGADVVSYLASAGTSNLYSTDNSNYDIVISRFDSQGALTWACRYGGAGEDDVNGAVTVDDNDNLFIAGTSKKLTTASAGDFPLQTLAGAFNLAWVGTSTYTRGYLLEFTSANTRKWATYLDNGASLVVFDVACGLNNDIYIAGKSGATLADAVGIPSGTGYQGAYTSATSSHNFIMRFNSSGALTWATWCPGTTSSTGRISDIAINKSNGDVFMMGDDLWSASYTFSTALISASMTYMGSDDMFYMKFNTSNQPVPSYGRYFGGAGFDKINIGAANGDIELDQYGNLYACGHTYSANFPVVNPGGCAYYDGVINDGSGISSNVAGTQDGYLMKINSAGTISYCTFFGGTAYTSMKQLKKDSHDNLWICGQQTPSGLATISHTDYYNQTIAGTSANIMFSQLSSDDHMEWLSYYGYSGYSEYLGFDIFEVDNDNLSLYLSGDFNNYVNAGAGYQYTSTSCSGAAIFNHVLSVAEPDAITPVVGATCNVTALTVSGTLPAGATWTWYTGSCGGTQVGTGATLNISPVTTTTYYVMAVGPCVVSNCIQITVTPPVTPVISVTNSSICAGQSTTLSENSGFSSYSWNTGSTSNSITVSPVVNTNYTVTVTDSNGCTSSASATINITAGTTPAFTALGPYCVGGTPASLPTTSTNGITGTWSPSSISTASAGTTVYTFTPTAGQCAATTTMSVVVDANITPAFTTLGPYCVGATPASLPTTSTNGISGSWSPSSISTATAGTTVYTFTPTAGQCAVSTTMSVTVNSNTTPVFTALGPYCSGEVAATLPTTSNNGISGSWSPSSISTASAGTTVYTFTPTAGQCAVSTTMSVTVTAGTTPVFTALGPYCAGASPASLPGTSNNGITGTWSPSAISTATAGTTVYTFTPTAGQCAATTTMSVPVNANITPTFTVLGPYCVGASPATLPGTSTNGITGTWSPATISTASTGATVYTFTPTAGQCATTATMTVNVNLNTTPSFTALGPYCAGATPAALPLTSNNGISGTWSPSSISTATAGTTVYTFTPTAGQCAVSTTMSVTVDANITPSFTTLGPYCAGATPASLPATSTNGITGTWSPSSISTATAGTTVYTFTPTAGQCATSNTMSVTVDANITPSFTALGPYCQGTAADVLPSVSNNAVNGTWSPSTISTASAGTIVYTFTPSAGQCAVSTTMPVVTDADIVASFTALGPYCEGDIPGVLSSISDNGISGSWSPATVNTGSAGITVYTFTPAAGQCSLSSPTMSVVVNSKPSVNLTIGSEPLCFGDNNGEINVSVTNGTPDFNIEWIYGSDQTDQTNYVIQDLFSGIVHVTVTDANSCLDSANINLTEPLQLSANVTETDPLCHGVAGSADVLPTGGTPDCQIIWQDGNTSFSNTNIPANTTFGYTLTDANSCTYSGSVLLNEPGLFEAVITDFDDISCHGQNTGSATVTPSGVFTYNVSYLWSTGSLNPQINNLGAGTYYVTLTDFNHCEAYTEVTISEPDEMTVTDISVTLATCGGTGGSASLSVTGGTPAYEYLWSDGSTSMTATDLAPGNYPVTVTDNNHCTVVTNATITATGNISAQIGVNQEILCNGEESAILQASSSNGYPMFSYHWSNGASSALNYGLGAGTYRVTVTEGMYRYSNSIA